MLRGARGWALFGVVWGLALAGIVLKSVGKASHPTFSTGLYLLMGCLVVVAVDPLFAKVPTAGQLWLVAGGPFYTVGVAFYATDSSLHFGHLIWHLFVMAGTACRYLAVRWYAACPIPSDEYKPTAPAFPRSGVSALKTGGMSATRR